MAHRIIILGGSGTGKSDSIQNLPPEDTDIINIDEKPLPFRYGDKWSYYDKEKNPTGNIFNTENMKTIEAAIKSTKKSITVVDDVQYLLQNEYMRRCREKSFDKFVDISDMLGRILQAAKEAPVDKRIYFLSHSEETAQGNIKMKTVGKAIDQYITPEGKATVVLRTVVTNDVYEFSTQNSGNDTCKSPRGMFDTLRIPNDLQLVDQAIKSYYAIN